MRQYYAVLKQCTLFKNFNEDSYGEILSRLQATLKHYKKNQIMRYPDNPVTDIGIVVEGLAYVTKSEYSGNRFILSEVGEGKTYGESLAFSNAENSPVEIVAAENTSVILFPARNLSQHPAEDFNVRLMQNTISLLAEKNVLLQLKNNILSQKTIRDKVLMYLEYESKTANSKTFRIHFSREELADFLCLNASAMSRELGKMRDEGILAFHKNRFFLKDTKTRNYI